MIAFLPRQPDDKTAETLVATGKFRFSAFGRKFLCACEEGALKPELEAIGPVQVTISATEHPAIHTMLSQFMDETTARTSRQIVAFQGARGAYSEQAILQFFPEPEVLPCPQFRDAFEAVRSGRARFAVLPIENALTGSIHDNYDLLLSYPDLVICGETLVRIRHHLYGIPGARLEDIRQVFSHPQGLLQCAVYLGKFPHWQQSPFYDTAGSVEHIKQVGSKENAAIAGAAAGKVYGMPVLAEGIETNHENYTRFVVLARQDEALLPIDLDTRNIKASIVFSLPHQPGALLKAMQTMGDRALNLSKIESRPIHGKPWEYMFYLDLEIGNDVDEFMRALGELRKVGEDVRVLGLYPKAR